MEQVGSQKISIKEYKVLFDTFYSPLCNFANKYLDDYDTCKDIVQEVFIKLWKAEVSFIHEDSYKPYLFKAVKNKALDVLKSKSYNSKRPLTQNELKVLESDSYFTREIILEESSRRIQDAVNTLPFKCKQIIDLSINGYKNDEISKELSISLNTVKSQKRIAYGKLRILLKGLYLLLVPVFLNVKFYFFLTLLLK